MTGRVLRGVVLVVGFVAAVAAGIWLGIWLGDRIVAMAARAAH